MSLLKEGKRVARKDWWKVMSGGNRTFQDWHDHGPCIFRHDQFDKIVYRTPDGELIIRSLLAEDIQADDWIEVE